jgi:hypothetical protein
MANTWSRFRRVHEQAIRVPTSENNVFALQTPAQ